SFRSSNTLAISILLVTVIVFPPELNQDKSEKHTTEVCKMGCVISRTISNAREKLNGTVTNYKILGLNWHRKKEKHKAHIWKHHPKGEQNSKNRPRRTNYRYIVKGIELTHKRI